MDGKRKGRGSLVLAFLVPHRHRDGLRLCSTCTAVHLFGIGANETDGLTRESMRSRLRDLARAPMIVSRRPLSVNRPALPWFAPTRSGVRTCAHTFNTPQGALNWVASRANKLSNPVWDGREAVVVALYHHHAPGESRCNRCKDQLACSLTDSGTSHRCACTCKRRSVTQRRFDHWTTDSNCALPGLSKQVPRSGAVMLLVALGGCHCTVTRQPCSHTRPRALNRRNVRLVRRPVGV